MSIEREVSAVIAGEAEGFLSRDEALDLTAQENKNTLAATDRSLLVIGADVEIASARQAYRLGSRGFYAILLIFLCLPMSS